MISEKDSLLVWAKDLENCGVALSATNLNDSEQYVTFSFKQIPHMEALKRFHVRDAINQIDFPVEKGADGFTVSVRSHATVVFRLIKE